MVGMLYQPTLIANLRMLFEGYSRATGLGITVVQRNFARDSAFLRRLETGSSLTASLYDRIVCRFARDWPDHEQWPDDVPRPSADQIELVLNA